MNKNSRKNNPLVHRPRSLVIASLKGVILCAFTLLLFIPLSFPVLANHQHCLSHSKKTTIIDKTYHYINTTFCQPALWFDDFFVDKRITEDVHAGTMIRWHNDFSLDENHTARYKTKLDARVHLPRVTRKLKLVFESDTEYSLIDQFIQEDEEAKNTLGLHYDWVVKEHQSLNIKVTMKPRIELRYRYISPLSDYFLIRFTQKFYQKKKITGSKTLLDVDYSLNEHLLLRWANFVKVETEESTELGTGLTLYQFISNTQAMSYRSNITAQKQSRYGIENYHLSFSYRQNILRRWFYYELKPEINWSRAPTMQWESEAKLTLRLEIIFDNI